MPGVEVTAHPVGDAFALLMPEVERATDPGVDGDPSVIEFRDAATGDVRSTVSSPVAKTWTGTWSNEPALYVAFQRVQTSDGLSAEQRDQVVEAYGADGDMLGSVSRPLDANLFAVVNGWVITRPADDKQSVTVAAPDGAVLVTHSCTSAIACAVGVELDSAEFAEGSSRIPIVVGDLTFRAEAIDNRERVNPLRVVAVDLTTGQQVWTTSTAERPEAAVTEDRTTGAHGIPIRMAGDALMMRWYTDNGTGFGDRGEVLSLHEPGSGRLLQTGPEVGTGFRDVLLEPGGTVAVVVDAPFDSHSIAWDTATGEELWRQQPDENPLIPVAIIGDVLIGDRKRSLDGSTSWPIAVDLRTKAVVEEDPDDVRWPVVAETGHAAQVVDSVSDDDATGVFVFEPAG